MTATHERNASTPLDTSRVPYRRSDLPALVRAVDVHQPLPALERDRVGAAPYRVAHLLVRDAGRPIGWVTLPFDDSVIKPDDIERAIRHAGLARPAPASAPARTDTGLAVSVVITTCGLTPELLRTVRCVLDNEHPVLEVIVVDNRPVGSAAPAALEAELGDDPRVCYVGETARGSSCARNRGLQEARGEIIAFADDDVLIDSGWVGAIASAFASDPQLACVTGLILPAELETEAQVLIEEYGGFSKGFEPRLYDLHEHRVDSPLYPYAAGTFGSGASIAFRREVLLDIGGYDPVLGAGVPARGGEDLDVQLRIVLNGHRLLYEPAAIVFHAHHRSMADLRRTIHGYGIGLSAFLFKHVVTSRRARADIVRRIPAGLRFQFQRDSQKNANKQADYPRSLFLLEVAGMARGPFAYARSRLQVARANRRRP